MAARPDSHARGALTGHGGYDRLEHRDDVPVPTAADGEVLVEVAAAGVNNTDVNTRIGWYSKNVRTGTDEGAGAGFVEAPAEDWAWTGSSISFPRIQGADACGRIVSVGTGVDEGRVGERIIVSPVFRSRTRRLPPASRSGRSVTGRSPNT
jgi:NADPH:quinone reductase-like Zn-dependent oxidoreductase